MFDYQRVYAFIGLNFDDVQPSPRFVASWQGGEGVVLCDFEAMHDVWNVLAELAGQEIPNRLWLDLKIPSKMGRQLASSLACICTKI
jgi:hypothetical protein